MLPVQLSPNYQLYRVISAADSGPFTNKGDGINLAEHRLANIQVVPIDDTVIEGAGIGASDPDVEVYFWNDTLGQYIQANPDISRAGIGAGVPYEFDVEVKGRYMFVALSSAPAGGEAVAIFVAGYDTAHTM